MAVYFIRSGNFVKIGKANNPHKRLRQLQTGSPRKLELASVIPGGKSEEKRLHAKYSHLRANGEWFHLSAEMTELAKYKAPDEIEVESQVVRGLSGWRLERNSNGYFRFRWQIKDAQGIPDTYKTETGNVGYRRGSKYLSISQVRKTTK